MRRVGRETLLTRDRQILGVSIFRVRCWRNAISADAYACVFEQPLPPGVGLRHEVDSRFHVYNVSPHSIVTWESGPRRIRWVFAFGRSDLGASDYQFTGPNPGYGYWKSSTGKLNLARETAGWGLALPWWFLILCFAIAPALHAWAFVRNWRRRRVKDGRCPRCGYDLRATPDPAGPTLAICPECGHGSPSRTP